MRGRVEGHGGDARADRRAGAGPGECARQIGLAIAGGQKPTASSVRPFRNASSAPQSAADHRSHKPPFPETRQTEFLSLRYLSGLP